ncbi:hypothetical protein ACF0H5_023950 [Mactra antiquata]
MTSKVIREWLAEYKVLSKEELHTYAASICHNGDLIISLHLLFDEFPEPEILDPICHQLFEFYRSDEKELQRFSLELIPCLIWLYLAFVSKGEKSKCGGVEAFLLSVYNLAEKIKRQYLHDNSEYLFRTLENEKSGFVEVFCRWFDLFVNSHNKFLGIFSEEFSDYLNFV